MNHLREQAIDLAASIIDVHYFHKCGLLAKTETSGRRELPPCQWTRVSISYDPDLFTRLCVDFHAACAIMQCGVARGSLRFEYTPTEVLDLYQTLANACHVLRDHEAAIGMPPPDSYAESCPAGEIGR